MIKASDLRIGNIIKYTDDDSYWTVESISETGLYVYNEDEVTWIEIEEFSPIPLTKEWLLKFSFVKSSYNEDRFDYKSNFHVIKQKDRWVFRGLGMSVAYADYVHSIQNIIHSLTGEELKIKE